MSETAQIVTSITTLVGVMFAACIAYLTARLKTGQTAAAVEVKQVKETLASAASDTKGTLSKIHALVNSGMMVQLKLGMELSEWKAAQLPINPQFVADAKLARRMYEEHVNSQSQVDAQLETK